MTEIGVAFYTPLGQHTEGLLGFPHPDYEVAVVDAADCPLPDGTSVSSSFAPGNLL